MVGFHFLFSSASISGNQARWASPAGMLSILAERPEPHLPAQGGLDAGQVLKLKVDQGNSIRRGVSERSIVLHLVMRGAPEEQPQDLYPQLSAMLSLGPQVHGDLAPSLATSSHSLQ